MISKFMKRSYKLAIVVLAVLIMVGAITLINSKNIGLAGEDNSSKIVKNKVAKEVKNKGNNLKDVN